MPDRNSQWTIGTLLAVAIALSMQISRQTAGLRAEMNQLRTEMNQRFSEMNRRLDSFDERLRAVEIGFAKVDQRLEIIERVVLPDAPAPPE